MNGTSELHMKGNTPDKCVHEFTHMCSGRKAIMEAERGGKARVGLLSRHKVTVK